MKINNEGERKEKHQKGNIEKERVRVRKKVVE